MKIKFSLPSFLITLLLIPVAEAAEWSLITSLNPSVEYDDNVLLNEDEKGSMHYALTPTATITRSIENLETSLSAGYQLDRYSSLPSIYDTENPFVRLNALYNTERSQYGLAANYAEANSRTTATEDTGDFATQSIIRTRSISPSYSYQLTERDSLSVNASYSERLYSTTDFSDNETKSLSAGWLRQFSERFSGGLNLAVSNYQSSGLSLSTDDDNYNLSTSFNYALSELWNINGNVGVRRLNSERKSVSTGLAESDSNTGSSLNFSAIRSDEINTYTINLSRLLTPSSTGDVNESDHIGLSWTGNISEYLTANIATSYLKTTSALEDSSEKRENLNFSPSLRWQLERNLSLNFKYNYRKQTRESSSDVDSNALSVTLNYDWDGFRISR